MAALRTGELPPPGRIVVSLPSLGAAEQASRIREELNCHAPPRSRVASAPDPSAPATSGTATENLESRTAESNCQVIVDIIDAWPEVFYQVLPSTLRKPLGPLVFAPQRPPRLPRRGQNQRRRPKLSRPRSGLLEPQSAGGGRG